MQGISIAAPGQALVNAGALFADNSGTGDAALDGGASVFGTILAGQIKGDAPEAKNGTDAWGQGKIAGGKDEKDDLAKDDAIVAATASPPSSLSQMLALVGAGVIPMLPPVPVVLAQGRVVLQDGGDQRASAVGGVAVQADRSIGAAADKALPDDKGKPAANEIAASGKMIPQGESGDVSSVAAEAVTQFAVPASDNTQRNDIGKIVAANGKSLSEAGSGAATRVGTKPTAPVKDKIVPSGANKPIVPETAANVQPSIEQHGAVARAEVQSTAGVAGKAALDDARGAVATEANDKPLVEPAGVAGIAANAEPRSTAPVVDEASEPVVKEVLVSGKASAEHAGMAGTAAKTETQSTVSAVGAKPEVEQANATSVAEKIKTRIAAPATSKTVPDVADKPAMKEVSGGGKSLAESGGVTANVAKTAQSSAPLTEKVMPDSADKPKESREKPSFEPAGVTRAEVKPERSTAPATVAAAPDDASKPVAPPRVESANVAVSTARATAQTSAQAMREAAVTDKTVVIEASGKPALEATDTAKSIVIETGSKSALEPADAAKSAVVEAAGKPVLEPAKTSITTAKITAQTTAQAMREAADQAKPVVTEDDGKSVSEPVNMTTVAAKAKQSIAKATDKAAVEVAGKTAEKNIAVSDKPIPEPVNVTSIAAKTEARTTAETVLADASKPAVKEVGDKPLVESAKVTEVATRTETRPPVQVADNVTPAATIKSVMKETGGNYLPESVNVAGAAARTAAPSTVIEADQTGLDAVRAIMEEIAASGRMNQVVEPVRVPGTTAKSERYTIPAAGKSVPDDASQSSLVSETVPGAKVNPQIDSLSVTNVANVAAKTLQPPVPVVEKAAVDTGREDLKDIVDSGKPLSPVQPFINKTAMEESMPSTFATAKRERAGPVDSDPSALFAMPLTAATQAPVAQVQKMEIAAPVGSPNWSSALADKVVVMNNQGNQVAELHLNPPHLGPLEVQLTFVGDKATAVFVSHHPAVREAIESSMPQLREMLAGNGIMLGDTMVGAGSFQQQQQAFANTSEGRKEAAANRNKDDDIAALGPVSGNKATKIGRGMVDTFV